MYKIDYVDWKGLNAVMYLHGYSRSEVEKQAMVAQGVFKITKITVSQQLKLMYQYIVGENQFPRYIVYNFVDMCKTKIWRNKHG